MPGHPDPPSFAPGHSDPPSWSPYSTDPPSWAKRKGIPAQSTFSTESQNWIEPDQRPKVEPISWASPQRAGASSRSMTTASSLTPTSDFLYAPPSIIHTKHLPTSNITLDSALTNFDTNISPWKTPSKYIDAEANHVNNIVHEIQSLTGRVEMEYASFDRTMIYSVSRECRNPLARIII